MIVLVMLIAVFVLLAIGVFSFELNRVEVARQQLRSACEAASLAGAATLASSDNTDTTAAQTSAINTAANVFRENSIIGYSLQAATITYSNPHDPASTQSSVYIELQDPNNNNAAVALGDPRGKTVKVWGNFGLLPAFGSFLGLGNVPIHGSSSGGVPSLDVVLCFDVSASIDDQTVVTFVRREWNPVQSRVDYNVSATTNGSPAGALARGRIYDIIVPPAIGSSVDGTPPQHLSDSNNPGKNSYPLAFSEQSGRTGSALGLRGRQETGYPPGNYPGNTWGNGAGTGTAQTYTDLVVNLDEQAVFGGATYNGFSFPDVATLVEAARGNLENANVFANSRARVPNSVTPRAGYKAAYLAAAAQHLHPICDAQKACQQFLTIMNTNTDAHFSLVAFTSRAGTSMGPSSQMTDFNVDGTWASAGSGSFLVPMIPLNPGVYQTNYTTCLNALPGTVPISGTNIGDAVNTAVNQLASNGRTGAKKAIIVFTDGQPTSAGPLDNSDPWRNAREAAWRAKTAGFPIYSIGLAQNPAIIPGETAILNDTNGNRSSGGISGIAGFGGKFFLVTNVADLRFTFENIARQLVQLVR